MATKIPPVMRATMGLLRAKRRLEEIETAMQRAKGKHRERLAARAYTTRRAIRRWSLILDARKGIPVVIPKVFEMSEAEYQATHVLNGLQYRLRDEFVSEETRAALEKWERARQIQDPDGERRYGKALEESQRRDRYRAIMSVRKKGM